MNVTLPHNFAPRGYQLPLWNHFDSDEEGLRGVAVWHRRAGKDLMAINTCVTKAFQRKGLYWHLLPTYNQGRKIVWDGFTRDGRGFLDHFPKGLISSKNNTDMRLTLANGSIYQVVGTDDPDRLVGTNPVGCIFSEFSMQDPSAWDLIRPILAENGGWALFIYTARGKNHGYTLLKMAQKNPKWFAEVLTVNDTKREDGLPVISPEIVQDERDAGMPEEMIQQEFYCSFEAPVIGAYYGKQLLDAENENRITHVPYDPKLQVSTGWDLGMADHMIIWFFQEVGMEIRVIDYYENSGEGLGHYIKVLREKPYVYSRHYAPHDIEVRELGTGKSRIEVAKGLGLKFTTVGLHEVADGIQAVRDILPRCWFESEKCSHGIEALRGYRKDWDDKNKCFKDRPLHDWTSHPADGFRTYAWGRRDRHRDVKKVKQKSVLDDYNYMRVS